MKNYWIQPVPFAVSGNVILPSRMMDDHSSDSADEDPDKKPPLFEFKIGEVVDPLGEYSRWMSPPLTSLNSIPPSPMYDVEQTEGGVDWSDARIQSWSGEEREQNEEFFAVGMRYHGSEESVRVRDGDNPMFSFKNGRVCAKLYRSSSGISKEPDQRRPKMTKSPESI